MRVVLCISLLTAVGCAHEKTQTSEPATAATEPAPASAESKSAAAEPAPPSAGKEIATNQQQVPPSERAKCQQPVTVHFAFNSAEIPEGDKASLETAALCLKQHQTLRVIVAGNTDDVGKSDYNQVLGKERADSVASFLKTAGASPAQLQTVSYGEDNPVCQENDEACRARNRRTAVRAACHL